MPLAGRLSGPHQFLGNTVELDVSGLGDPAEHRERMNGGEPVSFHQDALGSTDDGAGVDRSLQVRDVLRLRQCHRNVRGECSSIVDVLGVERVGPEGVRFIAPRVSAAVKSR